MTELRRIGTGCPMGRAGATLPGRSCLSPRRKVGVLETSGETYSRLFPDLPALGPTPEALIALGRQGGVCDGGTIAREAEGAAGWPFFGQFVAHDVTADRSPLERSDHGAVPNERRPRLNLESLYGAGPSGSPYLFDAEDPAKFLLAPNGFDVPRTRQGVAIIADPRNDSHRFMIAMHLAFLKAHNAFVDWARERKVPESGVFGAARQAVTWHYQFAVVEEFLPALVGVDTMAGLLDGTLGLPSHETSSLPYEFADAAYRYGHSQIRHSYMLQVGQPPRPLFPDLLGFRPLNAEDAVDWRLMFDGEPGVRVQRATRISERLPLALIQLPEEITGPVSDPGYRSLANRDMQRGALTDLPSGEAVARALGIAPLDPGAIGLAKWPGETPLWYYIAREADTVANGNHLGPVGGRIVGGVLLNLLDTDPASYRAQAPDWAPEIPKPSEAPPRLLNLLLFGSSPAP